MNRRLLPILIFLLMTLCGFAFAESAPAATPAAVENVTEESERAEESQPTLSQNIAAINGKVNDFVWGVPAMALILGVALASVNFLRIFFLTSYGTNVALIVSLTMFCTIIIAKLIGCSLPLLAKAIHLDPALMASPLITTLVDAASLTILFTIATRVFSIGAA